MDGQPDQDETRDWGPFGRPLFNDPEARALSRVGVIDVGSNSVRLVVFDGAARSPAYFYNEKIMAGLGAGMAETGHLNPEGRARALSAIRRFVAVAHSLDLPPLTAVATAAVREATDGPDFCADVLRETGLDIYVIDGREEARLSAQGVLLGWPGAHGLVCDIGGSSMELADLLDGQIGQRETSALGPLKLREIKSKTKRRAHIRDTVDALFDQMGSRTGRWIFLVGGSWRAIARIDMERRGYPLTVLHEYRLTPARIQKTLKYIEETDPSELRARCRISDARMALVPYAVHVLRAVVRRFKPKQIAISSYGIREGMLYEQMPQKLRNRDPLIEASRFSEAKDARLPGFGRTLYHFVLPLFSRSGPARKRLIRAACLLHDVSWRAHPDYRHEVVFDNTTRANLGGLEHWERVWLGMALLHRYSNKREGSRFEDLFQLLDEKDQKSAEVLGKAMRLGAMLWLAHEEEPGHLKYSPKAGTLELVLKDAASPLFGEVAQARFHALAAALGAKGSVRVKGARRGKN